MECKEFLAKYGEPECVAGFGTDWTNYFPAGGFDWQDDFRSTWVPKIDELIGKIKACRAKYDSIKVDTDDVRKGIDKFSEFFGKLQTISGNYEEIAEKFSEPALKKWLGDSAEMVNAIRGVMGNFVVPADRTEECDREILFLESFKEYFLTDLELDMILWAAHHIDNRYLTKVYRIAFKVAKRIVEVKGIVESSNSEMAATYLEKFKIPLEALNNAYATLLPMLRKFKNASKSGVLAQPDIGMAIEMDNEAKAANSVWAKIAG